MPTKTHYLDSQAKENQAVATNLPKQPGDQEPAVPFVDNRPGAIAQRKQQEALNNSSRVQQLHAFQEMVDYYPVEKQAAQLRAMNGSIAADQQEYIQRKENNTGLPDSLKAGIENLSCYSMDDTKVHYNSDKPAQLNAHAYAQGTNIHIGPGQEEHLPHEAWHVVQQKKGQVKPTTQLQSKVPVNDDPALEQEADVMGKKALQASVANLVQKNKTGGP